MTSHSSTSRRLPRQKSMYDSVSQLIPIGHEKQLKQALYTSAALILIAIVILVAASAYFVLQLFIKPLLWAVLCGSFLFPFKHVLQNVIASWLTETLDNGIPLVVNACILPITLFSNLSDWLGQFVISKWKIITAFISLLVTLNVLHYFGLLVYILATATYAVDRIWMGVYQVSSFMLSYNVTMIMLLILYVLSTIYFDVELYQTALVALWIHLLIYVVSLSGSFQIPIAIAIALLFGMGFVLKIDLNEAKEIPKRNVGSCEQIGDGNTQLNDNNGSSGFYFNVLFAMFALVVTWLHIWILLLMLVPLTFWVCKRALVHGKILALLDKVFLNIFQRNRTTIKNDVLEFWGKHKDVLFPTPLPNVLQILRKGDRVVHLSISSSLPTVTSILIILILFTNAIFMTVFLCVKVQQESFLLVEVTSNVINETVSEHPEYKGWLPDNETMQKSMDSLVDMVYIQGREWISQNVQTSLGPNGNNSKVEKQILKLWDQIYHHSSAKSPRQLLRKNSVKNISENTGLFHGFVDLLNMSEVMGWLQENVSALMSVGETLLTIIQSNVALIMSVLSAILSAFLNGGTIVLNFLLSMVIFFTSLFYLLACSTDRYKPVEVIGSAIRPLTMGTHFESAIQDAVNGVFGASIKMFGFYGLYTWINHSLFGSNLVYLPSILAAGFAVIPLLATYWICLPSAIEIWLLQGSLIRAVGLIICQFLPTLFVDTAIYKDISKKGGGAHSYVTGLAVAGGLYTFGLEGAVFGPLILCFLLVGVNLYSKATSEDE